MNMHALQIEKFGGPDVLKMREIPVPEPKAGELLVRVRAASVNPVDYKIRAGKYPAVRENRLPYILGRDISGTVEKTGPQVTTFHEGDEIYAVPGIDRGGEAEFVIVKEREAARKPANLDHTAAAAVPLAGLTAWQGLFRYGWLEAGQRVLIHAGSGGVGHLAIQFAKAKGAYVITTVSEKHTAFVRDLGADQIIDYQNQDFTREVEPVDLVFDLIGGETQDRSWQVLKHGGTLVSTLTEPSQEKARAIGARGMRFTVQESGAELKEIAALIDAGKVKPKVTQTFPLDRAAEAQQLVEEGHSEGKIVLTMSEMDDQPNMTLSAIF